MFYATIQVNLKALVDAMEPCYFCPKGTAAMMSLDSTKVYSCSQK